MNPSIDTSRRGSVATLGCVLILTGAISGCMSLNVGESRLAATGIGSEEAIVVLGRRHDTAYETEQDFTDCVAERLANTDVNLITEDHFVDALFPWFEPRTAPLKVGALPALLQRPEVHARIDSIGVRYIVWVDGQTEKLESQGGMQCIIGPAGGGCFGFGWWENESEYEAAVWDLKQQAAAGRVSADVFGTSYMPAIFIPIPLIARTDKQACKGLAKQLRDFIVD